MRSDGPSLEAVAAGLKLESYLSVWYRGVEVARRVPVGAGVVWAQRDLDVPDRLDASIPRVWEGVTLDPGAGGVLGALGHRVQLTVTLSTASGSHWWVQERGRFQVQDWERDGAAIRVTGHGMLRLVRDRLRARPYAPGRISPISGEVQSILGTAGVEVHVSPALSTTRRVPADFVQGEDMWAALTELVTAWPARLLPGTHGEVRILPGVTADLAAPDVSWHDGEGGTVLGAPVKGTRDGAFSHVLVKVKPEGDDVDEFVVEDWARTGPLAVGTFGWVSHKVESDAITTRAQAELVAVNELAAAGLRAEVVPVEAVPDWTVELDDVARVVTSDGMSRVGRVTGIELPLVAGTARYDVGVVA